MRGTLTHQELGRVNIEITIDNPGAYSKPWKVLESAQLAPTWEIHEYICNENNRDAQHLVGKSTPAPPLHRRAETRLCHLRADFKFVQRSAPGQDHDVTGRMAGDPNLSGCIWDDAAWPCGSLSTYASFRTAAR